MLKEESSEVLREYGCAISFKELSNVLICRELFRLELVIGE